MLTLINKQGMINRHLEHLPKNKCKINIYHDDGTQKRLLLCEWIPFDVDNYKEGFSADTGYIGTARVIQKEWHGIGFHAWRNNNDEFIYYNIIHNEIPT